MIPKIKPGNNILSIIITAFKEPKTIGKAIDSIENQNLPKHETIVVAPDEETLNVARRMKSKFTSIKVIKDKGAGKSAALNLAVSKSKGKILLLTDGDVYISKESIPLIIKHFNDKKIGSVSGRPLSINPKNNKYGYWAYLLTEIAHERRKRSLTKRKRLFCSGYLFAIRKNLFPKLPENLLSEDGYISHHTYSKGYRINYEEDALAYVKYPSNFKDWILQKKRSAGGYNQIKSLINVEIRSFKTESLGFMDFFKYCSDVKELIWIFNLFLARIYLWTVIYRDINFKKKNMKEIWKRVESTK